MAIFIEIMANFDLPHLATLTRKFNCSLQEEESSNPDKQHDDDHTSNSNISLVISDEMAWLVSETEPPLFCPRKQGRFGNEKHTWTRKFNCSLQEEVTSYPGKQNDDDHASNSNISLLISDEMVWLVSETEPPLFCPRKQGRFGNEKHTWTRKFNCSLQEEVTSYPGKQNCDDHASNSNISLLISDEMVWLVSETEPPLFRPRKQGRFGNEKDAWTRKFNC